MNTIRIGESELQASRIGLGCMRFGGSWDGTPITSEDQQKAIRAILTALDEGINFFDHADIYTRGKSEEVFSAIWTEKPSLREQIILQSKCGIRFAQDPQPDSPVRYDSSREHILNSVDGILKRLKTDYLDILLLHRPDPLIEPEEVAEAFDLLQASGKVRYFGVSNYNPLQMELLRKYLRQPLVTNQMQLALDHTNMIDEGIYVNTSVNSGLWHSEGTIEYCRLHGITLQAWSPMAKGNLTGKHVPEKYRELADLIARYAEEKNVGREAILIAWLLRHPAKIQPIIGTLSSERIKTACQADQIELSREGWYALYNAVSDRKLL